MSKERSRTVSLSLAELTGCIGRLKETGFDGLFPMPRPSHQAKAQAQEGAVTSLRCSARETVFRDERHQAEALE